MKVLGQKRASENEAAQITGELELALVEVRQVTNHSDTLVLKQTLLLVLRTCLYLLNHLRKENRS